MLVYLFAVLADDLQNKEVDEMKLCYPSKILHNNKKSILLLSGDSFLEPQQLSSRGNK